MEVDGSDLETNWKRILDAYQKSPAYLTVYPEAASSGFPYRELDRVHESNMVGLEKICSLASKSGRYALLPLLICEEGRFYNRQHLITPEGKVGYTYDKIHLIGALHEDRYLTPGEKIGFFTIPIPDPSPEKLEISGSPRSDSVIRIGTATCYDLRFPELFRIQSLRLAADLFLLPAMWPVERREHYLSLQQARAIENQTPLLIVNGVNRCGNMQLCGESSAFDARGKLLKRAPAGEPGIVDFYLDLTETLEWRNSFPALKDARFAPPIPPGALSITSLPGELQEKRSGKGEIKIKPAPL